MGLAFRLVRTCLHDAAAAAFYGEELEVVQVPPVHGSRPHALHHHERHRLGVRHRELRDTGERVIDALAELRHLKGHHRSAIS